ncbi:SH3 domain-containing protein [Geomonas azotofigens]|uniref:SH3 domain-containing protein n=1 Tax=Geomonas azotofigens TaxID=2843196 RepID=UPI001C0F3F7F|nr:SH3 domain-containing protein [Geomonas azotofigens]MBU5614308.1 SH3 domain-containing protein [Geomonas azotofigens]
MKAFLICALFLAGAATAALAALPVPRPYSGCGVLILKQGAGWQPESLALYQEPGVQRVADTTPQALPRLAGDDAEPLLAANERRGAWVRVALDEAGRQGWLAQARGWEYREWRDFLPGRTVRLLPGLKKEWYQLRLSPGGEASTLAPLSRDREVRVVEVEKEWARIEAPAGWLRWRDPDGRLTVSLK